MNDPVRVLIADDQRVVRDGLSMLLGLMPGVEVVGTAADGDQALDLARQHRPDIVLMDLRMPRRDGIEATRLLLEEHDDLHVIVLTTYADDRSLLDAIRAGARGYLTKDAGAEEIRRALDQVMNGRASIDPTVQMHLVKAVTDGAVLAAAARLDHFPDGLTPREVEVVKLIAAGLSNTEIAQRLMVAETTVKTHVNHILTKTAARDRAQLVRYAFRHGFGA